MKTYSIIVSIVCAILVASTAYFFWQNSKAQESIASLKSEVKRLQTAYATSNEAQNSWLINDMSIYLVDPENLIGQGTISLSNATPVHALTETNIAIKFSHPAYRLNDMVGFFAKNGDWVNLEAVEGEEIHLITTNEPGGPEVIAYYVCYSNYDVCPMRVIYTDIETN